MKIVNGKTEKLESCKIEIIYKTGDFMSLVISRNPRILRVHEIWEF